MCPKYFLILPLVLTLNLGFTACKRVYTDQDLDIWKAPLNLQKSFSYYLSGYDYDGQPVFVMEFGKWHVRNTMEGADDATKLDMDKYVEQMFYFMDKEGKATKNGTGHFVTIIDLEGYDAKEVAHIPTFNFALKHMAQRFQNDFAKDLDYSFLINVNYVAQTVIESFLRPVLADTFSKLDVSGTNKDKWIPKLLRKIPKESLPSWYGGSNDFRPLAVYGK